MIYIVGVGPGGPEYLTGEAVAVLAKVKLISGFSSVVERFPGRPALVAGTHRIGPFLDELAAVANAGDEIAVVVSGDPGVSSFAARVIARFGLARCRVIAGISSVQLAFARLGLPWDEAKLVDLHCQGELTPANRIALAAPGNIAVLLSPAWEKRLAEILLCLAPGRIIHLCSDLGTEHERIVELNRDGAPIQIGRLNLLVIANGHRAGGPGKLYAVGLGPGNPDWLSRQGLRLLLAADVVIVPKGRKAGASVAREIVDQLIPASDKIVELEFPMTTDREKLGMAWRQAASAVIDLISADKQVVFVTLGDPAVYSTFIYLRRAIRETKPDIAMEIVPGIPSFCGAAALLEMALCEGDDRLALAGFNRDRAEIENMLRNFETVVLYKIAGKIPELISVLQATGRLQESVLIHRAGFPDAKVVRDLRQALDDDQLGYFSMVIVRKERP